MESKMKKIVLLTILLSLALTAFAFNPRDFWTEIVITDGNILEYVYTETDAMHDEDFAIQVTDVVTGDMVSTETNTANITRVTFFANRAWVVFNTQTYSTSGNVPEGRVFEIVLTYLGNEDEDTNSATLSVTAPAGTGPVLFYDDTAWNLPLSMFEGGTPVPDPEIPLITFPSQGQVFEWSEEQTLTIEWAPGDGFAPQGYEYKWQDAADWTDIGTALAYETPLLGDGEYSFQVRGYINEAPSRSYVPVQARTAMRSVQTDSRGAGEAATVNFEVIIDSTPVVDYFVDFEGDGEIKGSYGSGEVVLSGIEWNMTEALIGNLDADWKNGERSARMRGYGASSMTMLEDKTGGLGLLSFQYRRYGSDSQVPWKVEYSSDQGNSWTQAGSEFTAPASDDVQTFVASVFVQDPVRIRIVQATGTGSSNRRLNIDDILLEDWDGTGLIPAAVPVFDPPAGAYLSAIEVALTSETDGASIRYTLDGTDPSETEGILYDAPIEIEEDSTIKAIAYAPGYLPSAVMSASYTFATNVANIAALREGATDGSIYMLSGEAILTFQQSSRNQKYIQDDTAAILIDDNAGNITTEYELYDGITGIAGTLTVYNGFMQFVPVADPGAATSSANVVVPEIRTLDSLVPADQAKLIKVMGLSFVDPPAVFANNAANLTVTDGVNDLTLRTFPNADYAGEDVPMDSFDLICLVGQFNADMQVGPRYWADFIITTGDADIPENVETPIGDGSDTVTIIGGGANIITGDIPDYPNNNMTLLGEYIFELVGAGPWTVVFNTDAPWGAYYANGQWNQVQNEGGTITFIIEASKNLTVPIILSDEDPTLPVELSSFYAELQAQRFVKLTWVSESETNMLGYRVYRNETDNPETALLLTPVMIQATNTSTSQEYALEDREVFPNSTYYYWLEAADYGHSTFFGPQMIEVTGEIVPDLPMQSIMSNAYPNPFKASSSTNIDVSIKAGENGTVTIYNIVGQAVKTFKVSEGSHNLQWNGRDNRGNVCASGIYFYKLSTPSMNQTRKMVIVK